MEDFERRLSQMNEKSLENRAEVESEQKPEESAPEQNVEKVVRIDTRISEELQKLNEVRATLGLEPTDHSQALEHLRSERERLGNQAAHSSVSVPEHIPQINYERLQKYASNIGSDLVRLAIAFRKRDDARLYPLLHTDAISRIGSAASRLQGMRPSTRETDYQELAQALSSIRRGLETFGKNTSREMREDPESLRTLAFVTQRASESLRGLGKVVSEIDIKIAEEVANEARRTAHVLDTVQMDVRKRASRLDGYLRRY